MAYADLHGPLPTLFAWIDTTLPQRAGASRRMGRMAHFFTFEII
jgi:hypothetical protein